MITGNLSLIEIFQEFPHFRTTEPTYWYCFVPPELPFYFGVSSL
jgi:hypothetical protein